MPLNYGKPTETISKKLRDVFETEFNNIYISNEYQEKGNESIRIEVVSSSLNEQISSTMEIRDYDYEITIYNKETSGNHDLYLNNRIDRAVFLLMSNRTLSSVAVDLVVNDVNYNLETDDNSIIAGLINVQITKENIF